METVLARYRRVGARGPEVVDKASIDERSCPEYEASPAQRSLDFRPSRYDQKSGQTIRRAEPVSDQSDWREPLTGQHGLRIRAVEAAMNTRVRTA